MIDKAGILDCYHLGEILKASAKKLGERCGPAAVDMLAHRLTEFIGSVEDDRYSYIWRSAIEDHEQDAHRDDPRSVLVDAVRDAALGATGSSSMEALGVAESLLKSPYPTLVRVGIYICGEHYMNVGAAFWTCFKENWLIDAFYWHEIYWFIRKAFPRFSTYERSRFLGFVYNFKGDWSDESRQEEWDEMHMRDILHPAFGLGDSEVDDKYQTLVRRWGGVRDHPDFHSYTSSDSVVERSPITSDALIAMSDQELVSFLNGFVPDHQGWNGSTYRGVASSISAAVRASSDGFARRINLFVDMARPYQHGLLRGLKERWSDDKRDIDWGATFSFLKKIVSAPAFKADLITTPTEAWEPTVQWVINDIADLAKVSSGPDRHLPQELRSSCLDVLQFILRATNPKEAGKSDDAVSHAINSPRGRVLEAFIHLTLAMRREEVAATPNLNKLWERVGPVFDAELASSEFGLNAEFAAMVGLYCVNLHYINPNWTETNFDRLFSSSNDSAWRCAAQGFAYQRYLYDWLFNKLVTGGHLRRMVYTEELPSQVSEKAIQFLGLAYLQGMENLDDGRLLSELISGLKEKELSKLCWFFWTLREKDTGEPSPRASKVLAFWMRVAEQIRSSYAKVPELHSALSCLAVFVRDLNPTVVRVLVEAAPHAQIKHHGYVLMEALARLASHYPKDVATIFRAAMLGFLPDYKKEDVIRCVKGLAEAGEVEEAEWICNAYSGRGSSLLKETYKLIRAENRSKFEPSKGGS